MIRAVFLRHGPVLCGFSLTGHAGTAQKGQDIVCAAVSSAAYMAVNTLTDVCHCPAQVELDEQAGRMTVELAPEQAAEHREILEGFAAHLCQLAQQYPRSIHTEYTEV